MAMVNGVGLGLAMAVLGLDSRCSNIGMPGLSLGVAFCLAMSILGIMTLEDRAGHSQDLLANRVPLLCLVAALLSWLVALH